MMFSDATYQRLQMRLRDLHFPQILQKYFGVAIERLFHKQDSLTLDRQGISFLTPNSTADRRNKLNNR